MTPLGFLAVFSAGDAMHLIGKATFFGKLVMLTLLVLSLLSWAVMIEKVRLLLRIRRGHALFWPVCDAWLDGRIGREEFRRWCQAHPTLPLSVMALEIEAAGSIPAVRRGAERALFAQVESLERYLMLLSTAVTISPFLGLIGTVWGIMTAFWEMASMRSANLLVVAPGIAEALVTTVGGLATAIPAVVFYNMFVRKIDLVTNEMERLRTLCEERVAALTPAAAAPAEPRRPEAHEKERIR